MSAKFTMTVEKEGRTISATTIPEIIANGWRVDIDKKQFVTYGTHDASEVTLESSEEGWTSVVESVMGKTAVEDTKLVSAPPSAKRGARTGGGCDSFRF